MSIATLSQAAERCSRRTVADLLIQLGDIPSKRVLVDPPPGLATEQDLLDRKARHGQLCELVDGVLVEKTMGWEESAVAVELAYHLKRYLKRHPIAVVLGTDGPVRTVPPQVRMPDVCVVRKDRIPRNQPRRFAVLRVAPDLAVEVLSPSNTSGEMRRKCQEYFDAGVKLVWFIDLRSRTATTYTGMDVSEKIGEKGFLTGGNVLPGFKLRLKTLLDEALNVE